MIFFTLVALFFKHKAKKSDFNRNIKKAFWICLIGVLLIDCPAVAAIKNTDPTPIYVIAGIDLAVLVWIIAAWVRAGHSSKISSREKVKEEDQANKRKFYDECWANGVSDADTPDHRQAVLLIARNHYSFSNDEEALRAFEEGKRLDRQLKDEQNRAAEDRNDARIAEAIRKARKIAARVASVQGKEKYTRAPQQLLNLVNVAYPNMKNALLYENSKGPSYVSHEKNWGIAGGIAQGIAGVGAGIMAASETIRQNESIRAQDQLMYNIASEVHRQKTKPTRDAVYDLEAAQKGLKAYLDSLGQILVDDTDMAGKASRLQIEAGNYSVESADRGVLMKLKVNVRCKEPPKVINNEAFVDGAILVKCFLGNELVGKGYLMPDNYLKIIIAEEVTDRHMMTRNNVYSDLSQCRLDAENTAVLVAEEGCSFSADAQYRFDFEPVCVWYTQKKKVKLYTEESVLHKPDRAISNYFYNNGGTAEMTYKALCISDGEKWNFDFRRLVLVKG